MNCDTLCACPPLCPVIKQLIINQATITEVVQKISEGRKTSAK